MEEGSLRCDVNLSLRPYGQTEYGTKTEIKNMNSFNSVARAIETEIARQTAVLESGGRVVQETRGWDEAAGTTHPMRSKEQAHDYRYFPDPDLTPVEFASSDVSRLRQELGALPAEHLERLIGTDKLRVEQAQQIVDGPGLFEYYAAAAGISGKPQATVNFLLGDLSRLANETDTPVFSSGVTPEALAELVGLTDAQTINSKTAKDLIARIWVEGGSPQAIVAAEGLGQLSDAGAIDAIVSEVIAGNAKTVDDYRAGKAKVMGFLVGQVMKASRGKANPTLAEARLRERLDAPR
jgi:aspartyl-tRNA(Asn)/glutamyl-tRNA(Gln) amidotransferase subunit B